MQRAILAVLCATLAVGTLAPALRAEEADAGVAETAPEEPKCPQTMASTNCDRCHGGKIIPIDRKKFEASAHFKKGGMDCDACHSAHAEFPHPEETRPMCLDCHDSEEFVAIAKSAGQSVHYLNGSLHFRCANCHSPHYLELAAEMPLAEKNGMCRRCHTEARLQEIHAWHPLGPLHLHNTACIACHTQPDKSVAPMAFKHKILNKKRASRACEDCHSPDGKMLQYLETLGAQPRLELATTELFKHFYLGGATRVPGLDTAGVVLVLLALAGVFIHGLGRAVGRRRKP